MDTSKFPKSVKVLDEEIAMQRAYCVAPLKIFLVSDEEITNIRDEKAYTEAKIKDLASSLNSDGEMRMQNPIHAIVDGGGESLAVIGGNRRLSAALYQMRKGVFSPDTSVRCYIYTTTNRAEVLRLAARDNAYRLNYTQIEEFRQVIVLDRQGLTKDDIGATIGVNERMVDRYLAINRYPIFVKMLEKEMPYSRLARIAEKLDKYPQIQKATEDFFHKWLEKEVPERMEALKAKAKRRNKTIKKESLALGKLLGPGEFEGWMRDLEEGNPPDGKPKLRDVEVTSKGNIIKISGVSFDLTKVTAHEISGALAAYEEAVPALQRAMRRKQDEESETDIDDAIADRRERYAKLLKRENEETDQDESETTPQRTDVDDSASETEGDESTTDEDGFDEDA